MPGQFVQGPGPEIFAFDQGDRLPDPVGRPGVPERRGAETAREKHDQFQQQRQGRGRSAGRRLRQFPLQFSGSLQRGGKLRGAELQPPDADHAGSRIEDRPVPLQLPQPLQGQRKPVRIELHVDQPDPAPFPKEVDGPSPDQEHLPRTHRNFLSVNHLDSAPRGHDHQFGKVVKMRFGGQIEPVLRRVGRRHTPYRDRTPGIGEIKLRFRQKRFVFRHRRFLFLCLILVILYYISVINSRSGRKKVLY